MAGSVVPIKPGPPVQVSGSNVNDMTFYNMSTAEAIWVGNSGSVAPNNGMRIGPLGTARWSKDSGLAYACVDTGVADTISLNISNDISNPANPVDVATATAVALLAQGVPNVLVTKTIFNQVLATGAGQIVDVSAYASIRVTILAQAAGNAVLEVIPFIPGGISLAYFLSAVDVGSHQAVGAWEIPVSDYTSIDFISIGTSPGMQLEVVGSNRVLENRRQLGNNFMPRQLICTTSFVAGTFNILTSGDGVADNVTRYNGPCKLIIHHNTAASKNAAGILIVGMYAGAASGGGSGGAGNLVWLLLDPLNTADAEYDFYHPSIPIAWALDPQFAAASVSITFTIIPAGGGF